MTDQSFETMRRAMVASQLRTNAVNDPRLVAALSEVPRERFVPAERRVAAYVDRAIPLDGGRAINPPMTTALLINEGHVGAGDRVLIIGAATGYAAAVLARVAREVVALEEEPALAAEAREALAGLPNVTVVEGPLAAGWGQGAPYQFILVDGAVERLPDAIVHQLDERGRLGVALIENGVTRLATGRRGGSGFGTLAFADAEAVRLPGFQVQEGFVFP